MTPLAILTIFHTAVSLVALAAGALFCVQLISGEGSRGLGRFFIATAIVTSATGFLFTTDKLLPSQIIGAIALVVLAFTVVAALVSQPRGGWRRTYRLGVVISVYLLGFVAVAQAFAKVAALQALGPPMGTPFIVAQTVLMLAFIGLGFLVVRTPH